MRLFVRLVVLSVLILGGTPAFSQSGDTSSAFGPRNTLLVSGFGFANVINSDEHAASFSTGFSPVFLWKIEEDLLFEGEVEFELEDGATQVGLEYAQIWWLASNYMMVGAGKFLNPSNNFMERLHPTWINKLPTMPLGVSGHARVPLIASTHIGAQVRGGFPVASGKITYTVYIANGPALNSDDGDSGEEGEGEHGHGTMSLGTLNFSSTEENNGDKALGGRLAVLPLPELEVGYSIETARVGNDGTVFQDVRAITHVMDLAYVRTSNALKGRVDVRGQVVYLGVDNPEVNQLEFKNESWAAYGQAAYQPVNVANSVLSNVELVLRYDLIDLPENAPLNEDQARVAVGLNYWLASSAVIKFAFESVTTQHEAGDETENIIIGQMALGF